ncbi:MAG TPA: hypothetical protein VMT16_10685 [Thermoanaerobaculia bacterium]|nr:hypothetical protein [Thermoanaerobaculia bacterium]
MDARAELWLKGGLSLLALALVLWRELRPGRLAARQAGPALALMAAIAAGAYYNFGGFHGAGYVHHWEQFHYYLGSKYFPELGYDGLYLASVAAQRQTAPELPPPPHLRDLATNRVLSTASLWQEIQAVERRFTPERWAAFAADHHHFLTANRLEYLNRIRKDHGYNPSPAWTFVARLGVAWLPASGPNLALLGWIDPLLLAVAFGYPFRTFGARVGCEALILFGLGYAWRFDWVGGAFLRQDWLAAFLVGICMLRRQRHAGAGALFAYGALVRIFPLAFLLGPAVVGLRDLLRRRSPRWAFRFAGGFLLAAVVGAGAGALTGRGAAAWAEFARNTAQHRETWLTNNVGLGNLLLYDRQTMERRLVDWSLAEPWLVWQEVMNERRDERRAWIAAAAGLSLLLVAAAAWRSDPAEAAALGPAAAFAVGLLTCYYWVMLVAVALRPPRWGVPALLALNAGLYAVALATPSFEAIYGSMSWGLALFFVAWTVAGWIGGRALRPAPTTEGEAVDEGRRGRPPRRPAVKTTRGVAY